MQKGFLNIAIVLVVAVVFGIGGYVLVSKNSPQTEKPMVSTNLDQNNTAQKESETKKTEQKKEITYHDPSYESNKKVSCPDPFIFELPIDINKATSILYPGQVRGNDYKAHGGFRFDHSRTEEITVVAPIDASVVTGARYPVDGEVQYTLEFEHPCGIRYRLGHLLTLTPKFQAIAEKFPLPAGLDSRTTEVRPPITVKKGEIIATAIGLTGDGAGGTGQVNTFLDWGVYDYRQKNKASEDPLWAASHNSDTYQYAVCWFDWISAENRAKVLALPPADGVHGKESDYCK